MSEIYLKPYMKEIIREEIIDVMKKNRSESEATMTDQASRDEPFEAWAKDKRIINDYEYARVQSTDTELFRECWQAALTHANTEMEKMREERDRYKGLLEKIASWNDHNFTLGDAIILAKWALPPTPQAGA